MRPDETTLHRAEQAANDDANAAERGTPAASLRYVVRDELRKAWLDGWQAGYSDGSMDQVHARLTLKEREEGR